MTDSETLRSLQAAANEPLPMGPAVARRLDAPHPGPVPSGVEEPPTTAAEPQRQPGIDLAQLRLHATQLASHLEAVREDLDRREAKLNARLSESESQLRSARLWLQERDEEMAGRTAALEHRQRAALDDESRLLAERANIQRREEDLARREAELFAARTQLDHRAAATDRATADLARQRQDFLSDVHTQQQRIERRRLEIQELAGLLYRGLDRRHVAIEEQYQRLLAQARLVAQEAYQDECQRATAELAGRQRALDDAEALLADAQQQLRSHSNEFHDARRRHEEQARVEREGLARHQRESCDEWERREQALSARSQQLDMRHAALEETRRQVGQLHRESLELRLASEELWARLTEAAPAAGLEQSLGRLRQRLAESYQMESTTAESERKELEALRERLAEQHARLSQEKEQLRIWVERRQDDIEQQAARLVAREEELDGQQTDHDRTRREWEDERRTYQAEIRRLLSEMRGHQAAA